MMHHTAWTCFFPAAPLFAGAGGEAFSPGSLAEDEDDQCRQHGQDHAGEDHRDAAGGEVALERDQAEGKGEILFADGEDQWPEEFVPM